MITSVQMIIISMVVSQATDWPRAFTKVSIHLLRYKRKDLMVEMKLHFIIQIPVLEMLDEYLGEVLSITDSAMMQSREVKTFLLDSCFQASRVLELFEITVGLFKVYILRSEIWVYLMESTVVSQ